jgi:hypothetical protein
MGVGRTLVAAMSRHFALLAVAVLVALGAAIYVPDALPLGGWYWIVDLSHGRFVAVNDHNGQVWNVGVVGLSG